MFSLGIRIAKKTREFNITFVKCLFSCESILKKYFTKAGGLKRRHGGILPTYYVISCSASLMGILSGMKLIFFVDILYAFISLSTYD